MPAKAADREGKLLPTSVRMTPSLRSRLEAAASKAGRSLTQEIERRLERAFEWDDAHGEARDWLAKQKAEIDKVDEANFEVEMRRRGWKPLVGSSYWITPDA